MAKPKSLPTFPLLTATFLVFSTLFLLSGRIPTPFTTSYSASKFALDGFFTSLRHELTMQKKNVSVTLCILGLIDTATALENTRCVFGGYRSRETRTATVFRTVCTSVWMCGPVGLGLHGSKHTKD